MSPKSHQQHRADIKQRDAIFALEGFAKTDTVHSVDEAVLAGLGTYEEAIAEMTIYVQKHKTTEGFIYSKAAAMTLPTARIEVSLA